MNHDEILKQLQQAKNIANQPHFDLNRWETSEVQILPDTLVSPGMFKQDTKKQQVYYAHPTTIKALKKNIFVAGNEPFEDLEIIHICESCKTELDLQFWHFCPVCEAHFPLESSKYIKF